MTRVESIGIKNTISSYPNQNIKTNTNNNSSVNEQKKIYTKLMIGASALAATIVCGLVITNQIKKGKMVKLAQQLEQEAVEREQAYIDKTYNSVGKSAKESAEFFETFYKNQEYVANLKKSLRSKTPVSSEINEAQLNHKNNNLEALNDDCRTMVGNEAAKQEQAYNDNNPLSKSAKDSEVFEQHFKPEEAIDKFKEKYAKILPILKLGEKDKFVYENGEVYIQKADGTILIGRIIHKTRNLNIPRPTAPKRPYMNPKPFTMSKPVGKRKIAITQPKTNYIVINVPVMDVYKLSKNCEKPNNIKINGKNYTKVANYKQTANGIIKTYYGKNPITIEVDNKLGELVITKDGYRYYYSIDGRELLDIKKIEQGGKPVDLKPYTPPPKSSNDGDDTPKIILIKLHDGKTAQLYKMPNGEILTPFEFHFPGAAKAREDAQKYLKQLKEQLEEQRRKHVHHQSIKAKEDVQNIANLIAQ